MLDLSARKVYGALAEQCVGGDAKADKVENATSGHLAGLDSNGNLTDSGVSPTEEVTVEGNPVQFDSPFEQDAKSVVVSVKPIQAGSGTPSPNNIRPISGIDEVEIPVTGKNRLDNTNWVAENSHGVTFTPRDDGTILVNGQNDGIDSSVYWIRDTLYEPQEQEILSGLPVQYSNFHWGGANIGYAISDVVLSVNNSYTIALAVDVGTSVDNVVISPMIRLATETDPTFEPYNPNSHTTTIPLPSTLYDADVDVTEGSADETKIIITVDNTWSYSTFAGKNYLTKDYTGVIKSYNQNPENPISSMCEFGGFGGAGMFEDGKFYQTSSDNYGDLYIQDSRYTTKETFLAAYGGCQICCELATPTTISLTPTDVELLKGTNVVSTNAEKVAVTYGRSLWQDIDDLKTDTEGKLDKSDVATIEGDTASRPYSVNEFMLRADGFYKVTQPIAQNASITASNTTKTTIGAVLTALLNG